jgi:hypothetical protein
METQNLTSQEDHEERENASNMEFDNMSEEQEQEQGGVIGTQMLPQIHLHTEGLALQKPSSNGLQTLENRIWLQN